MVVFFPLKVEKKKLKKFVEIASLKIANKISLKSAFWSLLSVLHHGTLPKSRQGIHKSPFSIKEWDVNRCFESPGQKNIVNDDRLLETFVFQLRLFQAEQLFIYNTGSEPLIL